jgi:hypothetical protein
MDLVCAMLKAHPLGSSLLMHLERKQVRDMQDGGMGSVEFLCGAPDHPRRARCIAEADYMDSDGTPVSIAINIDERGRMFEIDIWKVDFSQLRTYPTVRTIRNVRHLDV